jgi:hypothetical protein
MGRNRVDWFLADERCQLYFWAGHFERRVTGE